MGCGLRSASGARAGRVIGVCSMPRGGTCWRWVRAEIVLGNTIGFMQALDAWVFTAGACGPSQRRRPRDPPTARSGHRRRQRLPIVQRSQRSGLRSPGVHREPAALGLDVAVRDAGAARRSVYTIGDESHQLIEGMPQLGPESRGFESNRLLAEDATPAVGGRAAQPFLRGAARSGRPASGSGGSACACWRRRRRTRCACRSWRGCFPKRDSSICIAIRARCCRA